MSLFISLALKPGPLLEATYHDSEAESGDGNFVVDVTDRALEFALQEVTWGAPTLGEVVQLFKRNPSLTELAGPAKRYLQRCLDSAGAPPQEHTRFTPVPGTKLVLTTLAYFNTTTRAVEPPQICIHAEKPTTDESKEAETYGVLGIHISDMVDVPITYNPVAHVVEADTAKLHCHGSIETVRFPTAPLAKLLLGSIQEFAYTKDNGAGAKVQRDTPSIPASAIILFEEVDLIFAEPIPDKIHHKSIRAAVYCGVGDDECFSTGLKRLHPELNFKVKAGHESLTGYEIRKLIGLG